MGRPALYPWEDWLDGGRHLLARGRDFHNISAKSMQKQIQIEARKPPVVKVRTRTKIDKNGVEWVEIDGRDVPKPRKRHNWDAIFDGRPMVSLKRGTDFECPPVTMQIMALQAAQRRGLKVRTRVVDDFVHIWLEKSDGDGSPVDLPVG